MEIFRLLCQYADNKGIRLRFFKFIIQITYPI